MKINGKKFDILIAKRHLSFRDVAKKSNVSTTTLQNLRNGDELMPKTVGKIADALQVEIEELIEE